LVLEGLILERLSNDVRDRISPFHEEFRFGFCKSRDGSRRDLELVQPILEWETISFLFYYLNKKQISRELKLNSFPKVLGIL
jgi:hypothetical protein